MHRGTCAMPCYQDHHKLWLVQVAIDTNKARGAVEKWLLEVEERMFEAIHHVTERGIEVCSCWLAHLVA